MSLNWQWSDKMGEVVYENGHTAALYQGNALMIAVNEFEDDTYSLAWFAADKEHLRNMIGLNAKKGYDGCLDDDGKLYGIKTFRLNTRYKSVPQIVSDLAKAHVSVGIELYHEE